MTFNLTKEQQDVVNYIKDAEGEELILIDSVAGSGKTSTLTAIADVIEGEGQYLAYNKSIATSSKKKFPNNVDCRTTHSLAYRAAVVPFDLNVGFFGVRQVEESIPYKEKYLLVEDIREFCLSRFLTYDDYAAEYSRPNITLANKYLDMMSNGTIDCTHDFYLKMFHILLEKGDIDQEPLEFLMLDEAGDLNEVTLEIFKLIPARIKVAVGDPHQNIYTFNHTINCFERLEGEGKTFNLSKSFRVPDHIAGPIEKFCKKYLNPEMKFEGIDTEDRDIVSRGYISRTNGGLIDKIIQLNNSGTPYGLVRKAQEIFKVPLMVAGLRYQGKIYDVAYRHLQDEVDDWYENKNNVKQSHPTLLGYIRDSQSEDLSLIQAVNLISKHGKTAIFEAYAEAKLHESKKHDFMLMTAHSSKGLEFDEAIIAPDLNNSVQSVMNSIEEDGDRTLKPNEKETLNLYYVAVTRALVRLRNATHLISN